MMDTYLGIDAGTQSLKAIVISADKVVGEADVHFGKDLPAYRSPNGYLPHSDSTVRHADPRMWVEAMCMVVQRLADAGVDLSRVAAISGAGQQHGSVYLDANMGLARKTAPIWMDRSTADDCAALTQRFGARVQADTGSPPSERFTGPQIRKFAREEPEAYKRTAKIHLVSSYLCSVLIGDNAPIDFGDGAGMNLLNLHNCCWDAEIAEFTAQGLLEKLPPAQPSTTIAGGLCDEFALHGLRHGIPVILWTGDNPSSLIGCGAATPGAAVISLGTSDTLFAAMPDYMVDPSGHGHVFGNPAGGFMSLICFTNGSLARDKVRQQCGVDWNYFDNEALEITTFGNQGRMMLPFFEPESTPVVLKPVVKTNFTDATAAERIRAVLESQALSMRYHSAWQGQTFERLRVTGGAARSHGLRQILANVFQAPVETFQVANSAALGAAMRAAQAVGGISFVDLGLKFCSAIETIMPEKHFKERADNMLLEFGRFIKEI